MSAFTRVLELPHDTRLRVTACTAVQRASGKRLITMENCNDLSYHARIGRDGATRFGRKAFMTSFTRSQFRRSFITLPTAQACSLGQTESLIPRHPMARPVPHLRCPSSPRTPLRTSVPRTVTRFSSSGDRRNGARSVTPSTLATSISKSAVSAATRTRPSRSTPRDGQSAHPRARTLYAMPGLFAGARLSLQAQPSGRVASDEDIGE
jgi:hypothetical protein